MSGPGAPPSGLQKRNRVVAFVDILGASEDALEDRVDHLVRKIFLLGRQMQWKHVSHRISDTGEAVKTTYQPSLAQFSDCILLWSEPLDGLPHLEQANIISSFVWNLSDELGRLLMRDVPFRAGVSEGPVYIQPELNIFAGRPIVEAVELEGCQTWLGAAILLQDRPDRILRRVDQMLLREYGVNFANSVIGDVVVPVKDRQALDNAGWDVRAVNWAMAAQVVNGSPPTYGSLREKLIELKGKAASLAADKYDRGLAFLDEMERRSPRESWPRRSA